MLNAAKPWYVIYYYAHLMTPQERRAYKHLNATAKATGGRTDVAAQLEVGNSSNPAREFLSNDPEALRLASEGFHVFMMRTAQRILDESCNEVAFNYCPRCGALARTPKARQCRFCRHDWHSAA